MIRSASLFAALLLLLVGGAYGGAQSRHCAISTTGAMSGAARQGHQVGIHIYVQGARPVAGRAILARPDGSISRKIKMLPFSKKSYDGYYFAHIVFAPHVTGQWVIHWTYKTSPVGCPTRLGGDAKGILVS